MKKIITLFTVACSSALLSVFLFSQWKAQSSSARPLQNTPPIQRVNYAFAEVRRVPQPILFRQPNEV